MKSITYKVSCTLLAASALSWSAAKADVPKGDPAAGVAPSAAVATTAGSEKMKWWTDARFGMFIHFGLYSTVGRKEWVRTRHF